MPRPRARRSIHVELAPQDVYDFALGDLSSLADWMSSVDSVESADESWPAVGSGHVYTRSVNGKTIRGRTIVVEADPPRRVVMREEMTAEGEATPASRSGRSIWALEPEGAGTRMTMELEGAELSWPVWLVWRVLFGRQIGHSMEQSLANLKRICEEELEDAAED